MNCKECKNCKRSAAGDTCLAGLWDRNEDDFIRGDSDFEEYVMIDRFCTDFCASKGTGEGW